MQDSGQIFPFGYCMAAALPAIDRIPAVQIDDGRKNSTADGRGLNRVTKEFLGSCQQSTTTYPPCQAIHMASYRHAKNPATTLSKFIVLIKSATSIAGGRAAQNPAHRPHPQLSSNP